MAEGDKAIEGPTVRRCAFSVPWASQLTRKRGVVLEEDRQREMPGGRHLVETETGGFMITPLPGATELKAVRQHVRSSACNRRWSITKVTAEGGHRRQSGAHRLLAGSGGTLFGDHERFEQTYFSTFKNCISAATARVVMKMAITGSPGRGRRAERLRSPPGDGRD